MIFDWKFLLSIGVALTAVVVPVWLWQVDLSARSIKLRLASSVALQPESTSSFTDLQVVVSGVKLDSPFLSTLELTNNGSKPIPATDFEGPIEIAVNQGTQIVRARISSTEPTDLQGDLQADALSAKLRPLLLNPKDRLTFAIITSGQSPTFTSRARIAGISKIEYEDTTIRAANWRRAGFFLLIAFISLALYPIFGLLCFLPEQFHLSRPVAALAMVTSEFGGVFALLDAYNALVLRQTFFPGLIFSFVAGFVGVITIYRLDGPSSRT